MAIDEFGKVNQYHNLHYPAASVHFPLVYRPFDLGQSQFVIYEWSAL